MRALFAPQDQPLSAPPGIGADVVGCSRLMGDGLLAEFPSIVEAVECAVDIQQSMTEREPDLADDRRIGLRTRLPIGINPGDITVEGSVSKLVAEVEGDRENAVGLIVADQDGRVIDLRVAEIDVFEGTAKGQPLAPLVLGANGVANLPVHR